MLCLVFLGLSLGMLASGASLNLNFGQTAKPVNSVALSIIADYGGAMNDAFVFADTLQKASAIHVSAGQVTLTINNLDTAVNMNYSKTTIPFTFLNDTPSGVVQVR